MIFRMAASSGLDFKAGCHRDYARSAKLESDNSEIFRIFYVRTMRPSITHQAAEVLNTDVRPMICHSVD